MKDNSQGIIIPHFLNGGYQTILPETILMRYVRKIIKQFEYQIGDGPTQKRVAIVAFANYAKVMVPFQ